MRAVFPIVDGEARGDGWSARILPGGADFAFGLPDGSYAIEARYCMMIGDGTPVLVTNAGNMARQPDGSYEKSIFTSGIVRPVALPGVEIDLEALFSGIAP